MKNTAQLIAIMAFLSGSIFTSCSPKTVTTASNTKSSSTSVKKEAPKKEAEDIKTVTKTEVITEVKTETKIVETDSKVTAKEATIAKPVVPPANVEQLFKSKYPNASEVAWSSEMPISQTEHKGTHDYKANFVQGTERSTVEFDEKGEVVETRTRILPTQLPHNVYNAIKSKYPDGEIVWASTYKSKKTNGAYSAVIHSKSLAQYSDVILTEHGDFVH